MKFLEVFCLVATLNGTFVDEIGAFLIRIYISAIFNGQKQAALTAAA